MSHPCGPGWPALLPTSAASRRSGAAFGRPAIGRPASSSASSFTKTRPSCVSPWVKSARMKSSSTVMYSWKSSPRSFWSTSSRIRIIENSKKPAIGGGRM